MRSQFDKQLFTLGKPRLDLVMNGLPNRTPQQRHMCDKPPRPGPDRSLRMQRNECEAVVLEQEPA